MYVWNYKSFIICLTITGTICFSTATNTTYFENTKFKYKRQAQNICGPIRELISEQQHCIIGNEVANCPTEGRENEIIGKKCRLYYSNDSKNYVKYKCSNGQWISDGYCHAECGDKKTIASPLIVGGKETNKYEFPWVAAIYSEGTKICGGTIISAYYILSVAHCFTHVNGTLKNTKDFIVRVGKHYRDPLAVETSAQEREIKGFMIYKDYRGNYGNNDFDISLIEVTNPFIFSSTVRPICIDWDSIYEDVALKDGNIGTVTGWGFTEETGPRSDILRKIDVEYRKTSICFYKLPQSFRDTFFSNDKFCAGYINAGKNICAGDAGAGLVFLSNHKYYLRGIASTMLARKGGCDSNHYALYTRVSSYLSWIKSHMNKTDASPMQFTTKLGDNNDTMKIEGCNLPSHIPNGKFSLPDGQPYIVDDIVPISSVLYLNCINGTSDIPSFYCIDNRWDNIENAVCVTPSKYKGTCPSLSETKTESFLCKLQGIPIKCNHPPNEAIATVRCKKFYTRSEYNVVVYCQNGKWDHGIEPCVPECGTKTVAAQTLIINGKEVEHNEYPWVVIVYNSTNDHICGASIISRKYVLSAAHCFTNEMGDVRDRKDYTIMAGKHFRDKTADEPGAQEGKIKSIMIPVDYRGSSHFYQNDIALLEVEEEFDITPHVRPVCVDWESFNEGYDLINGNKGIVTGWGYTTGLGSPSKELKKLIVPYRDNADCKQNLNYTFTRKYLTSDKFCAGNRNTNSGVCRGDSGGGLYFKNNDLYYIRGITSLTPTTIEGCNSNVYSLYTKVSKFLQWLENFTKRTI